MSTNKKYESLRAEILDYIISHNLKHGDKLPTVREIIKTSLYSYTTVNRTLQELENEGLITKTQGKGIFVNRADEQVTNARQIALIMPKDFTAHKILLDILTGVRQVVEEHQYGLLISISNMSHEKEKITINRLIHNNVAGLIIFLEDNYLKDYSHIVELKENNYPFVLVDRHIPDLNTDYVGINNEHGMYKVCSYLKYSRFCDRIIFIASNDASIAAASSNEKVVGYSKAVKTLYGLDTTRVYTLVDFVDELERLAASTRNLGVCLNHDTMIADLNALLEKSGKSIPSNLHLFGYNNSYQNPPFPTVEQFNDEVGRKAAQILIDKFKNPHQAPQQILIEPKLVLPSDTGTYFIES
jgi:GntR family transcriptional regulator, arabinose operon transcriptional repressor